MVDALYEAAEHALSGRVGPSALEHCRRTGATAAELASVYGVDSETARLAGLLHDWDRDLGGRELIEAARAAGLEVNPIDEQVPYLLHARTAAAHVRSVLPEVPESVLDAVARHTVGSSAMTDLDRIVYIADMIEPQRDFEGVGALREAVGRVALDELFANAYAASLTHLIATRRRIHPDTVSVWNTLIARDSR